VGDGKAAGRGKAAPSQQREARLLAGPVPGGHIALEDHSPLGPPLGTMTGTSGGGTVVANGVHKRATSFNVCVRNRAQPVRLALQGGQTVPTKARLK